VKLSDADGKMLAQNEPIQSGSPMPPSIGVATARSSACSPATCARWYARRAFGLRRGVRDKGHPEPRGNVLDLTGDQRDEIVLWDEKRVWTSTPDRPFNGSRIYAPGRNPDYNESNYRTNVSLPAWQQGKAKR
jgi:rhamnogalacturonan endolyase